MVVITLALAVALVKNPVSAAAQLPDGKPRLVISKSGTVIDFHGRVIDGRSNPEELPDAFSGVGVEVTGSNVTLKNLTVRGFKLGIFAHDCSHLTLIHCNFSDNYRQHLRSTPDAEDESDWQSYHQNEKREWMAYGAGCYLENVKQFEIQGCTATREQCGLMLVKSLNGLIYNNNFSFLSGTGIGLYRSSRNRILHNKVDYCVRGYSYGKYYRGQDSSGILLYEQSNSNLIAYNSVTHGGDGLFLWAGQSTMDTGKGGCNDNFVYGNDFSSTVANAIEATFSRNTFENNLLATSWHGVWGGYSYDSVFKNNQILGCLEGVSIEHGQNNRIEGNRIEDVNYGIQLWADPVTDTSWGYPKTRDVASHSYQILNNIIRNVHDQAFDIRNTKDLTISGTTGDHVHQWFGVKYALSSNTPDPNGWTVTQNNFGANTKADDSHWTRSEYTGDLYKQMLSKWNPLTHPLHSASVRPLPNGIDPFDPHPSNRDTIFIDDWGPYDFKSPKLIPDPNGAPGGEIAYLVYAPNGQYRVTAVANATVISGGSGTVTARNPGHLVLGLAPDFAGKVTVRARYFGVGGTGEMGEPIPSRKPVEFGVERLVANINWDVKFYTWTHAVDPRTNLTGFEQDLAGTPIAESHLSALTFGDSGAWATDAAGKPIPENYFAVRADATLNFPIGNYSLDLVSDDGVRVLEDGKLLPSVADDGTVKNSFIYQGATHYTVNLAMDGKPHTIEVQYFQIDGGKTLTVNLRQK